MIRSLGAAARLGLCALLLAAPVAASAQTAEPPVVAAPKPPALVTFRPLPAWSTSLNVYGNGVLIGGRPYMVVNPGKPYSLTASGLGVRMEVRPGDQWKWDAVAAPGAKSRSEVLDATPTGGLGTLPSSKVLGLRYKFLIERGPEITSAWLVGQQWFGTPMVGGQLTPPQPGSGSPPFSIGFVGDQLQVNVNNLKADGTQSYSVIYLSPTKVTRDVPHDVEVQAKFDGGPAPAGMKSSPNGWLKIKFDGVLIPPNQMNFETRQPFVAQPGFTYQGPMGWPGMTGLTLHFGIYRSMHTVTGSPVTEPLAIQYSEPVVTSWDDPATLAAQLTNKVGEQLAAVPGLSMDAQAALSARLAASTAALGATP